MTAPPAPEPRPLLTDRAAFVPLMTVFFGTVVGVLTYFSAGGTVSSAFLAGIPASGLSAVAQHNLIAP
ncbi:hypothetical protein [Streptomyces sp. BE133]|uniref:hypothetical protein n=1 Tax=Streptomyces sp. BE133 TaxID=3002523 RepID=UPI002E7AA8B5|nr:hypothetical protein [Streptomyces sp. BE133]MEE1808256.1 hypothetical protein [Streptomyces sp. BE133]